MSLTNNFLNSADTAGFVAAQQIMKLVRSLGSDDVVRDTAGDAHRGQFRGLARGEFRGEARGMYRGESRGLARGEMRGAARGVMRGEFRGATRGMFRGAAH